MEILGFAVLGLVVFAFVYSRKVSRLSREVENLRAQVGWLHSEVVAQPPSGQAEPGREPFTASTGVAAYSARSPVPPPPRAGTPAGKAPAPGGLVVERIVPARIDLVAEEAESPISQPIFQPELPPVVPKEPHGPSLFDRWIRSARTTDEWEALIGARWLNRIGALAVILGLGFFLKYAIDENWINQTARVLLGLAVGAGLLGLAIRMHRRGYTIFAQGLVGAGISALYLSTYASYNFYHLVPQEVALVGLAAITVAAFFQAVYYDSLAVSLLAWAGGFITPVLLMNEHPNEIGLAAYVALLVAGILALLAVRRTWFVLELLTLAGSWGIFLLWTITKYTSGSLGLGIVFATLLWLLFHAKDVYDIRREGAGLRDIAQGIAVVNALVYFGFMCEMIYPDHHDWMALATLAIGAVYAGTGLATLPGRIVRRGVRERHELISIVALALATLFQFWGFELAILWALEALALVWIGVRWNAQFIWGPAVTLYGLAVSALLVYPQTWRWEPLSSFQVVVNERALAFVVLAGVAATFVPIVVGLAEEMRRLIQAGMQYAWCGLLFLGITVETNDAFSRTGYDRFMMLSILWMLYSLPLAWYGLHNRVRPVMTSALGSLSLALAVGLTVGAAFQPIGDFTLVLNIRAVALIVLIAGMLTHLQLVRLYAAALPFARQAAIAIQSAVVVLLLALITYESNDFFRNRILSVSGDDATHLGYFRFLVIAVLWMLYSLPVVRYAISRRIFPVLVLGLTTALLATGLGLAVGTTYQPIGYFIPVLNMRAATMLLLIGGLVTHHIWLKGNRDAHPWIETVLMGLEVLIVLTGFELATAELNDVFRHMAHVGSTQVSGLAATFAEAMALTGVWTVYALLLVWYGVRRAARTVLIAGLVSTSLAVGVGAFAGIALAPSSWLSLVLSLRLGILPLVLVVIFLEMQLLRSVQSGYRWITNVVVAFQGAIVLLGFELVSSETWTFFQSKIEETGSTGNLVNLQQLILSLSWLAYASLLLAIGFWKRTRWLRLGALGLLAITILKVFLYDLAFLETGFRSVSFAVLGFILIGASFLYSRFKDVLIADGGVTSSGRSKEPPWSRRPRSPRPPSGEPGHA